MGQKAHWDSDRRTERRRNVDLLINRFVNGVPYLCRVTDISRSGMRIVPMLEPAGGPRFVGLEFQLPGEREVIRAAGEVVRAPETEAAIGLRFTRVPSAAGASIARFVAAT